MKMTGVCTCKNWTVAMDFPGQLKDLTPRICDCDYCKKYPSVIISHPNSTVLFEGGKAEIRSNGDQLARFSSCSVCKRFLAVTSVINGQVRGAVNAELFGDVNMYGAPKQIQPYLLSADQKIERWAQLWGIVAGV
ncbi:MAG: hypothetical protein MJA28_13060 [Gammaproteobacteria bacterium]|nr:hypothetical protein [Gammaproteobacteria bacterium]